MDKIEQLSEVWKRTGLEVNDDHIKAIKWMIRVSEQLPNKGRFTRMPNLYIWGPTGTGKSTLLWLLFNTLRRNLDIPVVGREGTGYWNIRELIQETKESWNGDSKFLRNTCSRDAVLMLDDLGSERSTEFTSDMIDEIFNYRELAGWPTVVTSNLRPDILRNRYQSDRFASRFFGTCLEIHMDGNDRRKM